MMAILLLLFLVTITLLILIIQLGIHTRRYQIEAQILAARPVLTDLPTVSLCIPARNETHALADCLSNAVASDYPKLEIIVLDDCSQDKTSQIIRSFAQEGVRFVQGETPASGWLGKNSAYRTLAHEARGSYLVFMSVDTRFDPAAISRLVAYMQLHKLGMVSVLPRRIDSWRASVILAPLRYFWHVVLPLGINTPTATSLWAVRSKSLAQLGGFEAYKDKIMPENSLAKQLFARSEYRFLIANDILKVWYAKKWRSQVDTALRLWYPALGKSILLCALAAMAHFLLFVAPPVSLVVGVVIASYPLFLISLFAFLLQSLLFLLYLRRVQTGMQPLLGMFLLPVLALQEIVLILTSVYQYKRGRVDWKGRNVCYPAARRYF